VYEALTDSARWREDCEDLAAHLPDGRILDLGTGPGTSAIAFARVLPRSRLVGVDVSAAMLARAGRRARAAGIPLPLVRGDALRLPFGDATFDGAAGHSLLYLLPSPAAALAEVRRVVRPGGTVAFLEPRAGPADLLRAARGGPRFAASMALWRVMSGLHRRWDAASLGALLSAAGFRVPRAWPVLAGFGVAVTARR
jgi:ubiquinone/menaquinone biosynthesis C-methylase UbiE